MLTMNMKMLKTMKTNMLKMIYYKGKQKKCATLMQQTSMFLHLECMSQTHTFYNYNNNYYCYYCFFSISIQPITVKSCTVPCGPAIPLPTNLHALFQVFFTPALLSLICNESNLFAKQVLNAEQYEKYTLITPEELLAYFGFMTLMGINTLPALNDYWKLDSRYHYSPIADRIPRNRFREITRVLHFADNTSYTIQPTDNGYDRIWKIRRVVDILSQKFLEAYHPHNQNAIDEAMIPFKGRSCLKQYLPNKPTKRGIKVWVRADSTNGYISQLQVYAGKIGKKSEKSLGERVVKDLTRTLVGKNYTIYCDNYFTSVKLFDDLLTNSIYACGTLRSNRVGYPNEFKQYIKKGFSTRGESKQIQRGEKVFSIWQDNKVVNLLSTNCNVGVGTVLRTQKNGSRQSIPCPLNIIHYNMYMGGVDRSDQLRKYYCVRLKSRKYYRYIFWFLYEVAIANTYILSKYTPSTGYKHQGYIDFRADLANELIGNYNSRKRKGRPSASGSSSSVTSSLAHHFPFKAPKRSKCTMCYSKNILKWTQWRCDLCRKYLCHTGDPDTDCYYKTHTST